MKSIKYILSIWAFLAMTSLFVACTDEDESGNGGTGDGETLRISISAPDQKVISPLTKSSQTLAETIEDLCVLIYDNAGNIIEDKSHYLTSGNLLSTNLSEVIYKETIKLPDNQQGYVAVVANAGDLIATNLTKINTSSALKAYQFAINSNSHNPEFIMYYGAEFDLTKSTDIKAELVRIYSMVTVVVDQSGLGSAITVTPISLQLKNVPNAGRLVPDSRIGLDGIISVGEAEVINSGNTSDANFLNGTNKHTLFLYENMLGDGSNTTNGQLYKTPPGITPATNDKDAVFASDKAKSCPYIEIKAQYKNGNTDQAGIITYRFFLGKDAINNFDVQRNVHYKITMKLAGSGGENEVSWRVDYDYLTNIKAQDVYMSYRASSTARMYLEDVEDYVNSASGKNITIKATGPTLSSWPNGITEYFSIVGDAGNQIKLDTENNRYYIDIRTNITNIHDYESKTGKVTFTLTSLNIPGATLTREAKITQVPRLVDPIAYYKAASNVDPTEIIVKEFDATGTPGKYVTLRSVSKDDRKKDGKWSVEINKTTDGPWFKLALSEDGLSEGVSGLNGKLEGIGEVKFWYKPNSINNGVPRFAKLIVRYHDEDCMHDIFLRQGYDPISLGDDSRKWSSFNCLGTTSLFAGDDEYGDVTDYPTQTGWLFNGGVDRAMHPFIPGHRSGTVNNGGLTVYEEIEYSDRQKYKYGDVTMKINNESLNSGMDPWTHWQGKDITSEVNRTPSFKGPCPQGYVVADAFDYLKMIQKTEVYTGYVHDDDPDKGWNYKNLSEGKNAEIDNTNHCNPAKGALFVEREGCTNLFFNFGKGVLKNEKTTGRDLKLLEEIGIGHRYGEGIYPWGYDANYASFAQLTYMEAGHLIFSNKPEDYGAYYWNATPFSNHRNNMGKVDFGYNVFSIYPYLIDVPGRSVTGDGASGEARGINLYQNASFVRCVRKN